MTNIVSAQRRKENKMTNRDFYTAISNGMMNDEVKAFAVAAIEKLDARNTARKSKPSKTAEANAPIKEALFNSVRTAGSSPKVIWELFSKSLTTRRGHLLASW